jgi:transposase-like protein
MAQIHRRFTAEQKMSILKRHLLEQVPVSALCEEYGIRPPLFYRWQKLLFEQGASLFETHGGRSGRAMAHKVSALEEKLTQKNEVLSELMEEYVRLKKAFGGA